MQYLFSSWPLGTSNPEWQIWESFLEKVKQDFKNKSKLNSPVEGQKGMLGKRTNKGKAFKKRFLYILVNFTQGIKCLITDGG